jgi:hypothetical protein
MANNTPSVSHVDDVKASHIDPKVNDKFDAWLNKTYGSLGEVKTTRGPIHDYLGMIFDYSEKGIVKVDMCDYVKGMLDDFPFSLMPRIPSLLQQLMISLTREMKAHQGANSSTRSWDRLFFLLAVHFWCTHPSLRP